MRALQGEGTYHPPCRPWLFGLVTDGQHLAAAAALVRFEAAALGAAALDFP